MPRINNLPPLFPHRAQTPLARILVLVTLILLTLTPAATAQQYTNWTQLPACAQSCFSAALLQAFGSCGSILTGTGGNTTGEDDPPSTMLRRCICTDCAYRDTLGACLDSGCTAATANNDPGSVDGSLDLNDRVFCNASVAATVQMWDRNLIWAVGPGNGGGGASSGTSQGGVVWTCSSTSTSSTGSGNTGTGTAISRSSSSTLEPSAPPTTSTSTITAITTVATLTLATTAAPYQVTALSNSTSSATLTVPSDTGESDVSTSIWTSRSTDLSTTSRPVIVIPTTPVSFPSTTTTTTTTTGTTHSSSTTVSSSSSPSSSGGTGASSTTTTTTMGSSRAEPPVHPAVGLGILFAVLAGAPLIA
ncbi:hypothetical protein AYL99_10162 [Fonsecaea erecta]|uniref:Extracellular membrane protein CFEM domain-containing protein n=1 Tax=Fonsecaea erecta TaxID=1367422 RepID=A0A178Z899_9EURO|nr:hypothetical protein AYL99_10162 [Fonsecaea erecta]OAP56010.1 hypothetical protein AYL99_10162 [Fonsecaea erecta]